MSDFVNLLFIIVGATLMIMTAGVAFYRYEVEGRASMLVVGLIMITFGLPMMWAGFSQ